MARPTTKERILRMLTEAGEEDPRSGLGILPLRTVRAAFGRAGDTALLDLREEGLVSFESEGIIGDTKVIG